MNKKMILSFLTTIILVSAHLAEAQQTGKVPKIGYLSPGSLAESPRILKAHSQPSGTCEPACSSCWEAQCFPLIEGGLQL